MGPALSRVFCRRVGFFVTVAVIALLAAACASGPDEASLAVTSTSVTATRDGVIVAISVDDDAVTGGDKVRIRVTVLNAGLGPVSWQSGGCGLIQWFGFEGPGIPQPPQGVAWPGVAGLAKWSATAGGVSWSWIRKPEIADGVLMACPANLAFDEIGPGETITADGVWTATTTDGVVAPPGQYRITYAFPFVGRLAMGQLPPEPAIRPIAVALPIAVGGDAFGGIASTQAIDAALADPRVARWITDRLPKERLTGAEILLVDGTWRFSIHVREDRSTVVLIDPATGRVDQVQLAD